MSIFMFSLFFTAQAKPILPNRLNTHAPSFTEMMAHGPDGPPPDGGYEIKDDGGGNALGKLGLLCIVGGTVTGLLMLTSEEESENRELYKNSTIGLLGGGFGLIVLERVF